MSRGKHRSYWGYTLCLKHELVNDRTKPHRLFHSPLGRAVANMRPFVAPAEERACRVDLGVKGLSPLERSARILLLARRRGVRRGVSADASGWDASWGPRHIAAVESWERRWINMSSARTKNNSGNCSDRKPSCEATKNLKRWLEALIIYV